MRTPANEGRHYGREQSSHMRRKPAGMPIDEELRVHRASHLPCRDWCLERVTGRAKDWPRRSRNSQKTLTAPEVHLDDRVNREATVEDSSVALVEKDRETHLILAHVVLFKVGDTEWVREQVCRDLQEFGISRSQPWPTCSNRCASSDSQ